MESAVVYCRRQRCFTLYWLVLVLHVCIVSVASKECGDNPMKQVMLVAKRTGRSLDHVLMVLRDIDAAAFETLARSFRMYAACVGLVDTGYFRKRSQPDWFRGFEDGLDDSERGRGGHLAHLDSGADDLGMAAPVDGGKISGYIRDLSTSLERADRKPTLNEMLVALENEKHHRTRAREAPASLPWPYLNHKLQRNGDKHNSDNLIRDLIKSLPNAEISDFPHDIDYRDSYSYFNGDDVTK